MQLSRAKRDTLVDSVPCVEGRIGTKIRTSQVLGTSSAAQFQDKGSIRVVKYYDYQPLTAQDHCL